jgi:hypothetical protein
MKESVMKLSHENSNVCRAKELYLPHITTVLVVVVVSLFVVTSNTLAATIKGKLTNFDLTNWTEQEVTDLDMVFSGATCDDIDYYFGKHTGLMEMDCVDVGGGKIRVTFSGGSWFPVPDGQDRHFGLRFKRNVNAKFEKLFWTVEGQQVGGNIDFTGLNWEGTINCPVNISVSRAENTQSDSVRLVDATWAVSDFVIPLDNMIVADPEITSLPWQDASGLEGAVLQSPSDSATFTTPALDPRASESVLVRFTVLDQDDRQIGVFIEQAELTPPVPTVSEWGLIIMGLLLLVAGTVVIVRRRQRIAT